MKQNVDMLGTDPVMTPLRYEFMNLEIVPYVGVGPIRFGMTRAEVQRSIGKVPKPFFKGPDAIIPTDAFREVGIHVYYKHPDICEAVEMALSADPTFKGRRLIERPFDELLQWLQAMDNSIEVDNTGLTSFKFGFGLHAPSCEEFPSNSVEAVIAFEKGYYSSAGNKQIAK